MMGVTFRKVETGRKLILIGFGLIGVGVGLLIGGLVKETLSVRSKEESETH